VEASGDMRLSAGTLVGSCFIEMELARGAFAVVYRARHKFLGTTRAIKVLLPKWSGDADVVARFRQEASLLEGLVHPNIVRIFSAGEFETGSGTGFYLELEYVPSSLDKYLGAKNKPPFISTEELLKFSRQACEALMFIHGRKTIHRDIKPENLLLTSDNQLKLTDLGIAKILGAVPSFTIAGSPGFAAPEQLVQTDVPVDEKADIYGLGATIYFMLFKKTLAEQPLSQAPAGVADKELLQIIKTATAEYPKSRFSSAGEFLKALLALECQSAAGAEAPAVGASSGADSDMDEDFAKFKRDLAGEPDVPGISALWECARDLWATIKPLINNTVCLCKVWGPKGWLLLKTGFCAIVAKVQLIQSNSAVRPPVVVQTYNAPNNFGQKHSKLIWLMVAGVLVVSVAAFTVHKKHMRQQAAADSAFAEFCRQGQVFFQAKQYLRSSEWYERARKVKPADSHLNARIGLAYFYANLPYEAAEAFERAVKAEPQNPEYRVLLGKAYHGLNKTAEAVREWREALRLEPGNTECKALLKKADM